MEDNKTNPEIQKALDSIKLDFPEGELTQSGIAKELDKEEVRLAMLKIFEDAIKKVNKPED